METAKRTRAQVGDKRIVDIDLTPVIGDFQEKGETGILGEVLLHPRRIETSFLVDIRMMGDDRVQRTELAEEVPVPI
jgi:hypothetical protein